MTKEQLANLASRFTKIQLMVKSTPDKGTSFELIIPLDFHAA